MRLIFFILIISFCIHDFSIGQSYIDLVIEKERTDKYKKEKIIAFKQKIKVKKVLNKKGLSSEYIYDKRGNNIEHIRYHDDDTSKQRFIYKYDESDKLIEHNYYGIYAGWATKIEYKYDDRSNKIMETEYDARLIMSQIRSWDYDRNGILLKMCTIDWRYDTVKVIKYEHDNFKRISKASHFINTKIFNLLYEYKYDSRNNLIECTVSDNIGFYWKDVHEFDEKGNEIRDYEIDRRGNITNEKYIFDEHNNILSRIYYEGKDTNKIRESDNYKYVYNASGNTIEKYFITDENEQLIDKRFEYDEKGNLLRELSLHKKDVIEMERYYSYDERGNMLKECSVSYLHVLGDDIYDIKTVKSPEGEYCIYYEYEFFE